MPCPRLRVAPLVHVHRAGPAAFGNARRGSGTSRKEARRSATSAARCTRRRYRSGSPLERRRRWRAARLPRPSLRRRRGGQARQVPGSATPVPARVRLVLGAHVSVVPVPGGKRMANVAKVTRHGATRRGWTEQYRVVESVAELSAVLVTGRAQVEGLPPHRRPAALPGGGPGAAPRHPRRQPRRIRVHRGQLRPPAPREPLRPSPRSPGRYRQIWPASASKTCATPARRCWSSRARTPRPSGSAWATPPSR